MHPHTAFNAGSDGLHGANTNISKASTIYDHHNPAGYQRPLACNRNLMSRRSPPFQLNRPPDMRSRMAKENSSKIACSHDADHKPQINAPPLSAARDSEARPSSRASTPAVRHEMSGDGQSMPRVQIFVTRAQTTPGSRGLMTLLH